MDTLTVVHLETFEVSPMLKEVVSTITPLVAKNGNRLEVRCAEGLGALQRPISRRCARPFLTCSATPASLRVAVSSPWR
jgi:hypothetical protein